MFLKKIYLFIFGCTRSLLLPSDFIQLRRVGSPFCFVVYGLLIVAASPVGGAQALGARVSVVPHVGSGTVAQGL